MSAAFNMWRYAEAFSRHDGLFTSTEQERLNRSRVAIIGMGGVGGIHLMTLTRLGVGGFSIADPDVFELANFNRQYGANVNSLGRSKVDVMAEEARGVNPELEVRKLAARVTPENVGEFLDGVDLLVDGVDFFAMEARRLVFREARRRGIWAITAGPHAFGTGWLVFSPDGMSFDTFFDLHDGQTESEQIIAFAVGGTPTPLHLQYLNLSNFFKPQSRAGASVGFACNLAAGVVGAEAVKILLGRPGIRPAPWYSQFDAYRQKFVCRRLWKGNRHPWQRLKRWWLQKRMANRSPASVTIETVAGVQPTA